VEGAYRDVTLIEYDQIRDDAVLWLRDLYDIKLDSFCEHMGYSRRSVQRALNFHSTTWRRLILEARMNTAAELLSKTNDSIGDIAHEVGYSSHSLFTKNFTSRFGKSPSTWRNHRPATTQPTRRRNGAKSASA
jgi:AraC-like DNA-binding protein